MIKSLSNENCPLGFAFRTKNLFPEDTSLCPLVVVNKGNYVLTGTRYIVLYTYM